MQHGLDTPNTVFHVIETAAIARAACVAILTCTAPTALACTPLTSQSDPQTNAISQAITSRTTQSGLPLSSPIPTGTPAMSPPGFVSFCMRFSAQCATTKNIPAIISLTARTLALLNRINDVVNAAIAPETDAIHYGRAEYWTIPRDGAGDCEDYALAKRSALIAKGLPMDALRIASVERWDGEPHAVLTVTTDRGDYVLDNLRRNIVPWTDAGYTWIERQSANNPQDWVTIDAGTSGVRLASDSRDF